MLLLVSACLVCGAAGALAGDGGVAGTSGRLMLSALQIGLILIVSALGGLLFEWIGLPRVFGEIASGVAIGPYVLGGIAFFGMAGGLFAADAGTPVSPEILGVCTLAAVVFFFTAGLDTDAALLKRSFLPGSVIGFAGMALPFVLGDIAASVFSKELFGAKMDFLSPRCLFVGVVAGATSIGIAVKNLSKTRKLESPEASGILSAAVLSNIFTVICFAAVMGIVRLSEDVSAISVPWERTALWAGAMAGAAAASMLAGRLLKRMAGHWSMTLLALGIAFGVGGVFERVGLAMVVGSYIVGVSLAQVGVARAVRENVDSVHAVLVPVLFCTIGMMVDIRALSDRGVQVFVAVFTLLAVAGRFFGAGIAALPFGYNTAGAARIGAGLMTRGGIALAIAGMGMAAGILSPAAMAACVAAIFAVGIVSSPFATALLAGSRRGVRNPAPGSAEKRVEFEFSSAEVAKIVADKALIVFEAEGFSAHVLDKGDGIFQLRKDDMTIGMSRLGSAVCFDCEEEDTAFVATGMREVVAELEKAVSGLRRAVGGGDALPGVEMPARKRLSLTDYVSPSSIRVNLRAVTKEEAIEELLGVLVSKGAVSDVDEARRAVWAREESMSTGLQHGIAVPHGRTDAVSRLVCAIGLKREGIPFASLDGELSKIFILILSPEHMIQPYIQFMATVSQALNEKTRARLLACRTEREALAVLRGEETPSDAQARRSGPAGIRAAGPGETEASPLAEYVKPEQVKMALAGETKEEVIVELLHLLEENGLVKDLKEVRKAVLDRESKMSTGMQDGIAIPHARTPCVEKLVCAIGLKREGIEFDSVDGKPATLIILTLSPKETLAPHIQFMAMISRALNEAGRAAVFTARTRQEVCDVFRLHGSRRQAVIS